MNLTQWRLPASLAIGVFALSAFSADVPAHKAAADANNQIGFSFARKVAAKELREAGKNVGNVFVSPISLHYALSMALNGAGKSTAAQMLKYFGLEGARVEDVNQSNRELLKALIRPKLSDAELKKLPEWAPRPLVLTVNNGAWRSTGVESDGKTYAFSDAFLKAVRTEYGAETGALNFKAKKSADAINQWVSDKTYQMIPEIIDTDALSKMLWVLINTTYLEGSWDAPFRVAAAASQIEFNKLDGTKQSVPTISRTASTHVYQDEDVQAVEITVAGGQVSAYVVLPNKASAFDRLQTAENGIWSKEKWDKIVASTASSYVNLTMPKFAFSYGVRMQKGETLTSELGLDFLFQDHADFSPMATKESPSTAVALIKQNTRLEWDEKGIKAAAATLIGGARTTSLPPPPTKLVVDRPFYVAVYHKQTKSFLFLGQVTDPAKK